jgi:hypothetical protein
MESILKPLKQELPKEILKNSFLRKDSLSYTIVFNFYIVSLPVLMA